jgi:hypothetical protein
MIRLFRAVSLLMLILISGLVAIIGLTYRNTSRFAYLFSHPDGTRCETPCVFGADLVTMSVEQMDKILGTAPALKQATREWSQMPYVYYQSKEAAVNVSDAYIGIKFLSSYTTLGELVTLLGKPEQLRLFRHSMNPDDDLITCANFTFISQERAIMLYPDNEPEHCLSYHQPISVIEFYPSDPDHQRNFVPWYGFNTDEFYEMLMLQMTQGP